MKTLFYSAKTYDIESFNQANSDFNLPLRFCESLLTLQSVALIEDEEAICIFVNDKADEDVLKALHIKGIKLIALRCAGFNNVNIAVAKELGIDVVRVPEYSPHAVAEHTLALMLALNRKIPRAYNRVRDGNFALNGLLGFDFAHKTAGIVGTGRIGTIVAKILIAMDMNVIAYDPTPNPTCKTLGVTYLALDELFKRSDLISLHCPLNRQSHHLVDKMAFSLMKKGVMLINTGRGAIIDTCAAIVALKNKKLGYLGIDVYEQEASLFFQDLSCEIIEDDIFERLLTFPNVLITAHQGFFTQEALANIAQTTLTSLQRFYNKKAIDTAVLVTY